ncbi:Indole-3-glycerol phosphate synthase [Halomicronema hongdechloris C2206]|uniref:Indole-3-glycerol phosphate synthase n=1 Tax=Halomicronema hongdechloris C2206 TaxID=1641165 RepID=A0A1Z3HMS2_9CYAN|nr:Indole-3-glycerol phosphate synthase [Halomicronema hongdechloris C2206]
MNIPSSTSNTLLPISSISPSTAQPPGTILETIVRHKRQEVMHLQRQQSLAAIQRWAAATPPSHDFCAALRQHPKPSLIAEVKKASPSRGVIRTDFNPVAIAAAYEQGGAACLSVLTDAAFFQGSFRNLWRVRQHIALPLLCKEFIIDPYQIYLARVARADAVLLIAALLDDDRLQEFVSLASNLGMQALIEVHTLEELDRVLSLQQLTLIGINNRDLARFTVDVGMTERLLAARANQIKAADILVVSESGLQTSEDLRRVAAAGAEAVLIGESLVKQPDIKAAVRTLLHGAHQVA